jgi:hypothetical protein
MSSVISNASPPTRSLAPAGRSRPRVGSQFGPSAAVLVLGLTGGSDDEWWRLARNWRVAWLGTRIVLFAFRLVTPLLIEGMMRRWAAGRLGRH